jgi:flagellar motility protein MotE (MotC chaperone)
MDKRKAEYQDWLKRRDDFLKQAEAGLTDIYKKMKPDAAALQLQDVKPELAAAVIMRLGPRQSSLILNEMDSTKAANIASIIASASDPNTSKDPS